MTTKTIIAKGNAAIDLAATDSTVILSKYADPTEGAREGISIDEAREIAREDPSLIYATRS